MAGGVGPTTNAQRGSSSGQGPEEDGGCVGRKRERDQGQEQGQDEWEWEQVSARSSGGGASGGGEALDGQPRSWRGVGGAGADGGDGGSGVGNSSADGIHREADGQGGNGDRGQSSPAAVEAEEPGAEGGSDPDRPLSDWDQYVRWSRQPHRDSSVVEVDVARSLWSWTRGQGEAEREVRRKQLKRLLNAVVACQPGEEGRGPAYWLCFGAI